MSELEDILNYLETTSLEPHDDYVSEFSYKEQKTLWKYIKDLQLKNQELKKQQREFIDWLEIRIKDRDKVRKMYELYSLSEERLSSQYFVLQDVLLKYKEIIGGKN